MFLWRASKQTLLHGTYIWNVWHKNETVWNIPINMSTYLTSTQTNIPSKEAMFKFLVLKISLNSMDVNVLNHNYYDTWNEIVLGCRN